MKGLAPGVHRKAPQSNACEGESRETTVCSDLRHVYTRADAFDRCSKKRRDCCHGSRRGPHLSLRVGGISSEGRSAKCGITAPGGLDGKNSAGSPRARPST